jgi:LytS/YehU family sensor histidine kinase
MTEEIISEVGIPVVIINKAGAGRFLFITETSPEEAVEQMAVRTSLRSMSHARSSTGC